MLTSFRNVFFSILLVSGIVTFLSACGEKSNKDEVIKSLEESLVYSNQSISINNRLILHSLEDIMTDYATHEKATFWFPRANTVKQRSSELFDFLEKLRKEKNINAEEANELHTKLIRYNADILSIDPEISAEFSNSIKALWQQPGSMKNNATIFFDSFFKNSTPALTSAVLTKFQNNINTIENKILSFCLQKCDPVIIRDYFPALMVGQNTTNLKQGEALEIKVGIGSFSYENNMHAFIGGIAVPINHDGTFIYKNKISKQPGNYRIPIKVSFINQATNKEVVQERFVEYTVAQPCN